MKVLVLGGAGMLGHKVVQQLSAFGLDPWWTLRHAREDPTFDPVPLLRGSRAITGVDVAQLDRLDELVSELRPDVLLNCVGVIKQSAESEAPIPSITINSLLPQRLTATLARWNGRMIQISTDCVFSGSRGGYGEDDRVDPIDLYGRSKALGEVRAPNALTLRTSIIGRELRHHRSLLEWFLGQNGKRIHGYRRAIWSGVTSGYMASLMTRLITEYPRLAGLYHVAGERISKYDLLLLLRRVYDVDVAIEPNDSFVCDRSLDGSRLRHETGIEVPPLAEQVGLMVSDPTPYRS